MYKVYVKTNSNNYITAVNSSAFLSDLTGWEYIDEGIGDKYHHAQGNYFDKPIMTNSGVWQYKLEDGTARECTAEEIAEQEAALPEPGPTQEQRIADLEADSATMAEALIIAFGG